MGMLRWAKVAVVGYPVCNVAAVSINFTLSSHWRQYFHYVHEVISNAGAIPYGEGAVTPPISSLLLTPLRLGALALFMLWLYRAASTAVALRYPAQRSPALGAWSCILPVASLWFPYQALRDCLDPNDPDRGLVARAWVLLIVTELLSTSSVLVFAEAPSLAAPFLGVLIGLAILLVVAGYRMVTVISSAHGRVIASA
ncbi:MAG TPA: DUF4328 domain-containing protein [Acidimicrobiales bacterium]|nr:DUF4328 domain-containing protein [Acidimicrobiales bacterium]